MRRHKGESGERFARRTSGNCFDFGAPRTPLGERQAGNICRCSWREPLFALRLRAGGAVAKGALRSLLVGERVGAEEANGNVGGAKGSLGDRAFVDGDEVPPIIGVREPVIAQW